MTLTEIAAKFTGLDGKIASLESSNAAEATARGSLETQLKASLATQAEQAATISRLKAAAEAEPDEKEEASVTDAIKALENAITVLKGIAGQGGEEPAEDKKAEDDSDMEDDTEAKAQATAKNLPGVLAVRRKQLDRKLAKVKTLGATAAAATPERIEKLVTAKIAALGIPAPLALNKDGQNPIRALKPDGGKRAHALVRTGFNEDPAVAALNKTLGRSRN